MDLTAFAKSWKWLQDSRITPETTTVPTNDVTNPTEDFAKSATEPAEADIQTQTTVKPNLKTEKVAQEIVFSTTKGMTTDTEAYVAHMDTIQSTSNQVDDELDMIQVAGKARYVHFQTFED